VDRKLRIVFDFPAAALYAHGHVPLNVDSDFGERLRGLRTAKGWTQADLSHHSGVGKRSIEDYERGRVPRKAIPELARALGVTPHFLATGEETIEEQVAALIDQIAHLARRIGQLEEVLASAAESQERVLRGLDAALKLVLTQIASRDVLAHLDEPEPHEAEPLRPGVSS
jgi:transcriptional regulator with XRE-family HTH domain